MNALSPRKSTKPIMDQTQYIIYTDTQAAIKAIGKPTSSDNKMNIGHHGWSKKIQP